MGDVPRPRRRPRRWPLITVSVVTGLTAFVLYGLSRGGRDFGSLDGSVLVPSIVKRGDMPVAVLGLGELVRKDDSSPISGRVRIPESRISEIVVGQAAEVDARVDGGALDGHVSAIATVSSHGIRDVDISFDSPALVSAPAATSILATIAVGTLHNVLYIGRPVQGDQFQSVSMFRYSKDGREVARVHVKYGLASVETIQILDGLKLGDKVILNDMSLWDGVDRIVVK